MWIQKNKFLIIILFLSLLLRLININNLPSSVTWDEASIGYNSFSILKTQKDEWGNRFPLFFRAFGDYKLPVYLYFSIVPIFLFGLNIFSVRLVSVLAGTLIVFIIYKIIKILTKKESTSLLGSLLIATSPWGIFTSRMALEANLYLFFAVFSIYLFLIGVLKKPLFLLLSILMFGVSLWTYNAARVFMPILFLGLMLIYKNNLKQFFYKNKKVISIFFIGYLFFVSIMLFQLLTKEGLSRFNNIGIIDQGIISKIEEERNNSNLPFIVNRLINNKPVFFLKEFLSNYVKYLNPFNTFIKGSSHYQFSVQNHGLIYLIVLPFYLFGIFHSFKKIKFTKYKLILFWLVISPIAGSITRDAPHNLRSITMFPVIVILASIGFFEFSKYLKVVKKTNFYIAYCFLILIFSVNYIVAYLSYNISFSWSFQYQNKSMANFVNKNYEKYDQFFITKKYGEPHIFLLFFNKYNPKDYQFNTNLIRYEKSNWFWVDAFDKFIFVNDWDIQKLTENKFQLEIGKIVECNNKCILITSPGNTKNGWNKIDIIKYLDNSIAYEVYEKINIKN